MSPVFPHGENVKNIQNLHVILIIKMYQLFRRYQNVSTSVVEKIIF